MSNHLYFVDTETGGLDPFVHSLLSVGIAVWQNGIITKQLEYYIKRDHYNVTDEARKINKIDLRTVNSCGIPEEAVVGGIVNLVANEENNKAILAGHNVQFDVSFLKRLFTSCGHNYEDYFSHRCVDTSSICKYLYHAKLVKEEISSSDAAFHYFNIKVEQRHTALADAIATASLYNKMIELISDNREN